MTMPMPKPRKIYISTLVSAAAGIAALGVLAGCGSSGSAPAAAASVNASGTGAYAAYTQCLSRHGVTLPGGGYGGRRSPGASGFTRPTDRPSGGFGGGFASANPTMAAAMQACSALRPTGAPGFGGAGGTRLAAFRNCMSQQGEPLPSTRPTAYASGQSRYLGGLSTADPKVAAALAVCKPLIPTGAPAPAATAG